MALMDESVTHSLPFFSLIHAGELAFGKKGRSASAGKPRIPPFAEVEYDLKLVALPGEQYRLEMPALSPFSFTDVVIYH